MNGDNRPQAFTLEAFFAALIIISSIVFALQATAITPLTSSTSSEQIRNQQTTLTEGFLAISEEDGTLKNAILHWNATADNWNETEGATPMELAASGHYNAKSEAPAPFRETQLETFGQQTAVNVELIPRERTASGDIRRTEPLYLQDEGQPTENTIVVERQVVLYDDDRLTKTYDSDGDGNKDAFRQSKINVSVANDEPSNRNDFYANDISPNTELYNVVTVRVTVWRI